MATHLTRFWLPRWSTRSKACQQTVFCQDFPSINLERAFTQSASPSRSICPCLSQSAPSPIEAFSLRFIHSHSGATGVFWLQCRIVYFRLGESKVHPAAAHINHILSIGDVFIIISVNCALQSLVYLVLGRSRSATH